MYRRRKCLVCGETFGTMEVPEEILDAYCPKIATREILAKLTAFLKEQEAKLNPESSLPALPHQRGDLHQPTE